MPDLRAKRPQLKSDAYKDLRQWMLDMWEYVNGLTQVSGDGSRILVSQSKDGTVIRLQEDEYKKQFPFYVDSLSGGQHSENSTFNIKGGMISTPNAQFKFSEETKFPITKKYVYLKISNSDAATAEDIPTDSTQQDIDDSASGLFGKITESDAELTPIEGSSINILLGTHIGGVFFQRHIGDVYIYGGAQPAGDEAWHAYFEDGSLEIWSVADDGTFPEIVPSLQLTVEGEIINDRGTTKTGEIDPNNFGPDDGLAETVEHTVSAGSVLWFYVKLSNLDATQVTWVIATDTNEPDVDAAPDGEKWVVLYKVATSTGTYTEDGSNRSGTKFTITQIHEGPIDLRETPSVKLYMVTEANYAGNPTNENIYKVREVQNYSYDGNVTYDANTDIEGRVSAEGFEKGLVVGRVYESFITTGGTPELKAPETYSVKVDGGSLTLYNSHFGQSLYVLGSDIEILSNATVDIDLFEGVWFHANWDSIRGKLTTYIPTM